ncbi:DUF5615 family PIN-like protein [Hydrogenimonas cancrithermarum]|uniref:DUF5615 domain-containing protein n=1 Tax=Hydrogenimonas cancrithermarum TaxID=2993563 RepID=A0ABM8FM89_9BACT|nr:DUF5615 family PIN-like protein [Hydrogenimonas cancrithermarum]BDY13498.1 hypothetical protein HCR_18100 [Hydrogenimonas cancrithermarum]
MKYRLLFDNNISHRVVSRIAEHFPEASHVMLLGLDEAKDSEVWHYARRNRYAIVTKDSDFNDIAILKGSPPKVVWIKIGNCRVDETVAFLIEKRETIANFLDDETSVILEI